MANENQEPFSKRDLIFDGIRSIQSPDSDWSEVDCFVFRLPPPNSAALVFIEVERVGGGKRTFAEIDDLIVEHIHGLNTHDVFKHYRLTYNTSRETI